MKFKKVSNNFWRVEINGKIFAGKWEALLEEIQNEN